MEQHITRQGEFADRKAHSDATHGWMDNATDHRRGTRTHAVYAAEPRLPAVRTHRGARAAKNSAWRLHSPVGMTTVTGSAVLLASDVTHLTRTCGVSTHPHAHKHRYTHMRLRLLTHTNEHTHTRARALSDARNRPLPTRHAIARAHTHVASERRCTQCARTRLRPRSTTSRTVRTWGWASFCPYYTQYLPTYLP